MGILANRHAHKFLAAQAEIDNLACSCSYADCLAWNEECVTMLAEFPFELARQLQPSRHRKISGFLHKSVCLCRAFLESRFCLLKQLFYLLKSGFCAEFFFFRHFFSSVDCSGRLGFALQNFFFLPLLCEGRRKEPELGSG